MIAPSPDSQSAGAETLDVAQVFDQFDRLFDGPNPISVAVSGGSDSLAVLALLNEWSRSCGATICAMTFDHGMRIGSAGESDHVAQICQRLGVEHHLLHWSNEKPRSGIQAAARLARYAALCERAAQLGARAVVTGHTLDDQLETFLMRLGRGEPPLLGLSAMAVCTGHLAGCEIVRPMLGISRQTLRAFLIRRAISWCDDPSNDDLTFERVRMRRWIARLAINDRAAIGRYCAVAGRYRAVLAGETGRVLRNRVTQDADGSWWLDLSRAATIAKPVLAQVLRAVVAVEGGGAHRISTAKARQLLASAEGSGSRSTVGHCVIETVGGMLKIDRENRNLKILRIEPGQTAVWDNRFAINNQKKCAVDILAAGTVSGDGISTRRANPGAPLVRIADGGKAVLLEQAALSSTVGLAWRRQAPALEQFCPQYDYPILNWFRDHLSDQTK